MNDEPTIQASDFGRRLYRLGQNWRREIDVRMRKFGLTDATWRPLLYLGRFGDGMRQIDLAAAIDIEGPSLVRLLDALGNAGLVERIEGPEDRRSKTLRLTPAGRETYAKLADEYESVAAALMAGVAAADIATCMRVFAQVDRTMVAVAAARAGEKT